MDVDPFVQHRDPDGKSPHQETRSRGGARSERATEREVEGRDEPARDAEPNDRAFAFCGNDAIELSERERNYGIYMLGKTGSGKTVALTNSALLDIAAGKALVFFDPHGDAARSIMDSIPPHRAEKLCYLDLSDVNSVAWNPLADVPADKAALAAINLTDALKDIWPDTWGERLASFLRNGFHLLIEHGNATLREPLQCGRCYA
jgi:type IV secretory pathway TraG/TraD family ATPase VirD4